jgi:hypothetical protein
LKLLTAFRTPTTFSISPRQSSNDLSQNLWKHPRQNVMYYNNSSEPPANLFESLTRLKIQTSRTGRRSHVAIHLYIQDRALIKTSVSSTCQRVCFRNALIYIQKRNLIKYLSKLSRSALVKTFCITTCICFSRLWAFQSKVYDNLKRISDAAVDFSMCLLNKKITVFIKSVPFSYILVLLQILLQYHFWLGDRFFMRAPFLCISVLLQYIIHAFFCVSIWLGQQWFWWGGPFYIY